MVSKEGHADIFLGHEGIHPYWVLCKIHLIYWMTLVYLYKCLKLATIELLKMHLEERHILFFLASCFSLLQTSVYVGGGA